MASDDTMQDREAQTASGNMTDIAFWDGYWGQFVLPDRIDERHTFDRALARKLRQILRGKTGRALEVGCAPGRWLEFLASDIGFAVSGIEYTAAGVSATRRNLQLLGVEKPDIMQSDFFEVPPEPVYDLVVSFGFIEHFEKPEAVVRRHANWVRPGGCVVLGVPNFNGIHGWLQRLLDPSLLEVHNLSSMRVSRLTALGEAAGLVTETADYIGSFEPSLPIARQGVHSLPELLAKVVLRMGRAIRRAPVIGASLDGLNGSWISSYVIASFRKPG